MKKLYAVGLAIIFFISLYITLSLAFLFHEGRKETIDPEFAVSVFEEDVETREFTFGAFQRLYFLEDRDPITEFSKKTEMISATPNLKIVNSKEYRVAIKTNADVFDKLKIGREDNIQYTNQVGLVITFADDCYAPVHVDDVDYDYDTGLYVGFDVFEVTVYAPIETLMVDSKVVIDYEAPSCERLRVDFSFEGTTGCIYGIDAEDFSLYCSGTSNLQLLGEIRGTSEIKIFHNTKIDANALAMGKTDFFVSSAFFGEFSYIEYNNTYDIGILNLIFMGGLIFLFQVKPIFWFICFLCCIFQKSDVSKKKIPR